MWKSTKEINRDGRLVIRAGRATGAQGMAQHIFWSWDWPTTGRTPLLTEWRLEVKMDTGWQEASASWGMKREWVYTEGMKTYSACEPRYIYLRDTVVYAQQRLSLEGSQMQNWKTGRARPSYESLWILFQNIWTLSRGCWEAWKILTKGGKRSKWGLDHT